MFVIVMKTVLSEIHYWDKYRSSGASNIDYCTRYDTSKKALAAMKRTNEYRCMNINISRGIIGRYIEIYIEEIN